MADIETCHHCRGAIRWLKTERGTPVPVEGHTASDRDTLYNVTRGHMAHRNFCAGTKAAGRRRA